MKINIFKRIVATAVMTPLLIASVSCSKSNRITEYGKFSIVPMPASVQAEEGTFMLRQGTGVVVDPDFASGGENN
jgi:hypothetical protein